MPPLTAAESGLGLCRLVVLGTDPVSSTLHPWEAAQFHSLQRKVLKYRLPILVTTLGLKGLLYLLSRFSSAQLVRHLEIPFRRCLTVQFILQSSSPSSLRR